mmetsp:Transcript_40213/g.104136  ORF Transcript_40213/g.104136 Transcript_40213/m.104136 type:complete len:240 (-) Transcript_40213:364-1083(-)
MAACQEGTHLGAVCFCSLKQDVAGATCLLLRLGLVFALEAWPCVAFECLHDLLRALCLIGACGEEGCAAPITVTAPLLQRLKLRGTQRAPDVLKTVLHAPGHCLRLICCCATAFDSNAEANRSTTPLSPLILASNGSLVQATSRVKGFWLANVPEKHHGTCTPDELCVCTWLLLVSIQNTKLELSLVILCLKHCPRSSVGTRGARAQSLAREGFHEGALVQCLRASDNHLRQVGASLAS